MRWLAIIVAALPSPSLASTWSTALGTPLAEETYAIAALPDGDLMLCGRTAPNLDPWSRSNGEALVARLAPDGTVRWARTYGGDADDGATGIAARSDGSVVVTGFTHSFGRGASELWILELDGAGDVLSERILGERDFDGAGQLTALTGDRALLVSGTDGPGGLGGLDGWLVEIDPRGRISQTCFGADGNDALEVAVGLPDGGSLLYGVSDRGPVPGWPTALLVRLGAAGDVAWQQSLGEPTELHDCVLAARPDGGAVLAGWAWFEPRQPADAFVLVFAPDGALLWGRRAEMPDEQRTFGVAAAPDGSVVLAADVTGRDGMSDAWLLQLDSNGAFRQQAVLSGLGSLHGQPRDHWLGGTRLLVLPDGDVVVGGSSSDRVGWPDAWMARLGSDWSVAACVDTPLPAPTLHPMTLSPMDPALDFARPAANPSRSSASVLDIGLTPVVPCEEPCGTVLPREVSGPPWTVPLLVRDRGRLTWEDARRPCESYAVHRGRIADLSAGDGGACVAQITVASHEDAQPPGEGAPFFYLVAATSDAGDGPLGTDSFGRARPNPTPCR